MAKQKKSGRLLVKERFDFPEPFFVFRAQARALQCDQPWLRLKTSVASCDHLAPSANSLSLLLPFVLGLAFH